MTVGSAVGCFADYFGFAVAVEVGNKELCIVSTRADVFAEVNAPFASTVEFIAVKVCRAGETVVRVVVRVCGVPFEDDFILAVTVNVAYRCVVGCVEVFFTKGFYSEVGALDWYVNVT